MSERDAHAIQLAADLILVETAKLGCTLTPAVCLYIARRLHRLWLKEEKHTGG